MDSVNDAQAGAAEPTPTPPFPAESGTQDTAELDPRADGYADFREDMGAPTEAPPPPSTEARRASVIAALAAAYREDRKFLKDVAREASATLAEIVAWRTMGAALATEASVTSLVQFVQMQQQRAALAARAAQQAGIIQGAAARQSGGGPQLYTGL